MAELISLASSNRVSMFGPGGAGAAADVAGPGGGAALVVVGDDLASSSPLIPTNAPTTATVATTASTTAKTIAAVGHRRLGTGCGASVGCWDGDRICVSAKAGLTTRGSVGAVGGVSWARTGSTTAILAAASSSNRLRRPHRELLGPDPWRSGSGRRGSSPCPSPPRHRIRAVARPRVVTAVVVASSDVPRSAVRRWCRRKVAVP